MTSSRPLLDYRPTVSVVLPVFNAARWLQTALDSITAQTFRDFELIAIDDGSSDDSLAILRRHATRDPRLRVLTRPNTGIVGALNDGLAAARGWLVARMDADDEAAPERLARQVARLSSDPDLVAVGSAVTFMDATGRSVQSCPRPQRHADIERRLLAGDGGALIHPAVMFRTAAVRAVGGYRGFAQYIEDLDLFLRLAHHGQMANLAEPLLRYRVHPASINFTRQAGRRAVKLLVLREAHAARGLDFYPEQFPDEPVTHGDPAWHAREWAVTALAYGSRRVAIGHGWRAVRLRPRDAASWRALKYALTAPRPRPVASSALPHLLYIGQMPAEGAGSPVIILRHLQRLALAGWRITIIAANGQDASACLRAGWMVLTLPLRRWWWPPFRRALPGSRAVRTSLLAGECRRLTAGQPPDAVLGYLAAHDDFYTEIASRYARRTGVPLSLFVHDDAAAFTSDPTERHRLHRRHGRLLRSAHRCWFVSPELATVYALPAAAPRVLPPIPAGRSTFAGWQDGFALRPRVYYAGFIWPAQFPLLARIAQVLADAGAHLVLLTRDTSALREFMPTVPVSHVESFATNGEALAHLTREAAGLLVAYAETVAQMPWIATSFPSKLVEYTHLGLPCAIVAPADSAVGRWAERNGYADFIAPANLDRLAQWARDLRTEATWRQRGDSVRHLADGEFNSEKIQAAFAAGLLRA